MSKRILFISRRTFCRWPQNAVGAPALVFRHRSPRQIVFTPRRDFSQDEQPRAAMPATMSGLGHIWPSPLQMIKNFFMTRFIIPRIDPDFNLPEFMNGAKKAIEVISHLMSKGDYDTMNYYVEPYVVASIKDSLKNTSLQDLQALAVDTPDIMVSFPYSVEALFRTEDAVPQKRIEVLVICHVLKGWGETKENPDVVVQLQDSDEMKKKVQFVNYQFSRTYVDTKEGDWLVTGIHHFKPNVEG